MNKRVVADTIRAMFSDALSEMYREEVPLYADLLGIVREVNSQALARNSAIADQFSRGEAIEDYNCEPHGAIRVGTASELADLRRVFRVMGMFPVGYYDLSVAGVPVHSTAFRPVEPVSFDVSPLRIFCSLLRLELVDDEQLREHAAQLLESRQILSDRAMELVVNAEAHDGLMPEEAAEFVAEVLETFRWRETARVTSETYRQLNSVHRLVADVVAFRGPHINHLTPRTLDIDAVQEVMLASGINAKARIEGPPRREVGILLRQTSFQALSEPISFLPTAGEQSDEGSHTARFGEIEQRGAALTPKGRRLYDQLLTQVIQETEGDASAYDRRLQEVFVAFPDDSEDLRKHGLAYFEYRLTARGELALEAGLSPAPDCEALIAEGYIEALPMTYEDFLPVSAAGIFQSNLGDRMREAYAGRSSQDEFERALGERVLDPFALYAAREEASRRAALEHFALVNS